MREALRDWIADADTRSNVAAFDLSVTLPELSYQDGRLLDLYSSLVGELFDLMRASEEPEQRDWAALGSGLVLVASQLRGRAQADALFYGAAAYYIGGWSASAYLTMRRADPSLWELDAFRACYDLIARPAQITSDVASAVVRALGAGASGQIAAVERVAVTSEAAALQIGPDEWVSARVLARLLDRFRRTNVRAVLPEGDDDRWTPLVNSLLERRPAVWDFFPSQIEAIQAGLLSSSRTFSMQMPTGAGKTALTETLIFDHLVARPAEVAVLLVPYRSLARELRHSLGRRLTDMGLPTRAVYGGTVPTPEETQDLDTVRAIIATPEAMTGLLGSVPGLSERISLLVCDEGHLLDSGNRGVGLELLLSRFLSREVTPRVVFVSAVVPNIEELNAWLGGTTQTVVRSTFRPADTEFAVLRRNSATGTNIRIGLELRAPIRTGLPSRQIPEFLTKDDFAYLNASTNRWRTYAFGTFKTQAVASARKALHLGAVALFTRTKGGNQGVISLAEELIEQLQVPLDLPAPNDFLTDARLVAGVVDYLRVEYGQGWSGTRALEVGAVLHHGDVPQETREALEELLTAGQVNLVMCTSTLAEGVNLPIRTLVLYNTQIRSADGSSTSMLAREIRNLVGRAGRAGSATKGLAICVNEAQWSTLELVADGAPGEPVEGALLARVQRLVARLIENNRTLNNTALEATDWLLPLVDGIDATLIELLSDDMGDDDFRDLASTLASSTYAWQRSNAVERSTLAQIFSLRADRLCRLRTSDRIRWVSGTGVKARLLDSVVDSLIPGFDRWQTVETATDPDLLDAILEWAWRQPDFAEALSAAYPAGERPLGQLPERAELLAQLRLWLGGATFAEMAAALSRPVDQLLRVHTGVVSYTLTTLVEQVVVILTETFGEVGVELSSALEQLPDYIRYGVSSAAARNLMAEGLRHRRAANLLAGDPAMSDPFAALQPTRDAARTILASDPEGWREDLGAFVYARTVRDLGLAPQDASPSG